MLQAAWQVLEMTGHAARGIDLAERVAAMPGLGSGPRAAAATVRGLALRLAGRLDEADTHLAAALAAHRERGDRRSQGHALLNLANLQQDRGRMDEAREHLDAVLALCGEPGPDRDRDRRTEGRAHGSLGNLHREQGRMDEARAHYDAGLALVREVGDRHSDGVVLGNLGNLHLEQGRVHEAREHFDAALTIHREVGSRCSRRGRQHQPSSSATWPWPGVGA